MSQLQILDMSDNTSHVGGGKKVILVCEKVSREDIKVRLWDGAGWEGWGEFGAGEIHKQCAITFLSPPYPHTNISRPVRVSLELVRPSDGATSQEKEFFYNPPPPPPPTKTSGGGGSTSSQIYNDLDYAGLELEEIGSDLQLNIPVTDFPPPSTTLPPHQTSLLDVLDNFETDETLLNLSGIMKELGLKPPLDDSKTGTKRSSKDAENDSASLSYLWKIGDGEINQTPDHNPSHLSEFLHNCQQINDL